MVRVPLNMALREVAGRAEYYRNRKDDQIWRAINAFIAGGVVGQGTGISVNAANLLVAFQLLKCCAVTNAAANDQVLKKVKVRTTTLVTTTIKILAHLSSRALS
jgi:hypothetical protein